MIDIGQNDLAGSPAKNLSYVQLVEKIPIILQEIKIAIKVSLILTHSLSLSQMRFENNNSTQLRK